MAKLGKTKLNITNLREGGTLQGKLIMVYSPSGSGKTRSTGTLPGVTVHLSLDNGSGSAVKAAELFGMDDTTHMEVLLETVHDLNDSVDFLLTDNGYKASVDNVVVDNLVEVASQIYSIIAATPRYKKDQLQIDDILDPEVKVNAENKKGQALYKDAQEQTRNLVKKIGEMTQYYNVIVLTADKEILAGNSLQAGVYPYINGPSSVQPMTMLFDEVYYLTRKEGDFDTKEEILTKFKITSFSDRLTGKKHYAKTRTFTGNHVVHGEVPADFRLVLQETSYILKKDRKAK